jgi:Phage integrase family
MMLRRRGIAAGIAPGAPEFLRLHPHGLRHLAAKTAADMGTPLPVVQAVLGHRSLGTTGIYLEERDPRKIALFPAPSPPEAVAPSPAPVRTTPARPLVETVGVPVPVEAPLVVTSPARALPKAERLVAIGGVPPIRRPLPSTQEIARAEATRPLDVYSADTWGERKHRQLLGEGLPHTYIGKTTGLVWWDGATGNLRPQMPVAAPMQFLRPGPHGNLREALAELWWRRVSGADPKHAPTSAYALLEWVKQAVELSAEVNTARRRRGGEWVAFDAPTVLTTVAKGEAPFLFRVHREDKIALWFELRSQAFMGAAGAPGGRVGQAVDKGPKAPLGAPVDWYATTSFAPAPWYDLPDPVAALPDAERAELVDWLLVLTGQLPIDDTLLFKRRAEDRAPSLSRRDLASLLLLLCAYDDARDAARDAAKDQGRIASRASLDRDPSVRLRASHVDASVASLTGGTLSPPFHVQEAVMERVQERHRGEFELEAARKAGGELPEEGATRESRSDHYLRILERLFGKAAAADRVLKLYSLCAKSQRLAEATFIGGDYKDFFRIDPAARTVAHTDSYKDEFTRRTGADSECVARRVARHLWEQKRAGKMKHFDKHPSDLLWQLNTWAFYKVPCPAAAEQSLAARLKRLGKDSAAALFALLQGNGEGGPEDEAASSHEERGEVSLSAELEAEAREEGPGEGTGAPGGEDLRSGHQITAMGRKAEEPPPPPLPVRVLGEEEKAAILAKRAKEAAATPAPVARALPKKPPPRPVSFHENAATARGYLANARALVPDPVTLLIWIYS